MTERAAYRVKEFAEAIGVDRVTVWRWIKAGKLETIKVAGLTLIPAHIFAHIPSGHSMQHPATGCDAWPSLNPSWHDKNAT